MADQKEFDSNADLEHSLDAILQVAQLILRDKAARDSLNKSESAQRVAYWRAFFQVVLSHPFGTLAPGATEWQEFAKILDLVRISKLRQRKDLTERIKQYSRWRDRSEHRYMLYVVAQFWNADEERAPAFVVNPDPARPEEAAIDAPLNYECTGNLLDIYAYWTNAWALMDTINTQQPSNYALAPVSIGNFIVRRSWELNDTCPIFQLHVGPGDRFQTFEKRLLPLLKRHYSAVPCTPGVRQGNAGPSKSYSRHVYLDKLFRHLDVPEDIVQMLLHTPHTRINKYQESADLDGSSGSKISTVRMLGERSIQEQANAVAELAEDGEDGEPIWECWKGQHVKDYLEYVRAFFLWNYYLNLGDTTIGEPPTPKQLRLMLLNNLLVARSLLPEVKAENKKLWHYQYFIPTWYKSTSYLALITRGQLSDTDLGSFRKFAERLFGLAWAHDSARKLEEDKAALIKQAERAARAVILARNFSHTVGSHVLSSPGFAMALTRGRGGEKLDYALEDLSIALTEWQNLILDNRDPDPACYLEKWINLLDNTSETLHDGLSEAQVFYRFLQGRFDFIARAIEDHRDPPEPAFFVEDLVDGFLSQTVFLDHLVRDLGWGLNDLSFRLYLPSIELSGAGVEAIFDGKWLPSEGPISYTHEWVPRPGTQGNVGDFAALVGVPGGPTGTQAFHAVLENVIRNSFKYGGVLSQGHHGRRAAYTLSLRLSRRPDRDGWGLQLWDNFSQAGHSGNRESPFGLIEECLRQPIVNTKTGELIPEGLGIKEMRICAQSLSPQRNENSRREDYAPLTLIHPSDLEQLCPAARVPDKDCSEQPLVYEMSLEEPVLLAIYDKNATKPPDSCWIRSYRSLSDLSRSGAHIAIMAGDCIHDLLDITENGYLALPYRLLVVCKDAQHKAALDLVIQNSEIPRRRVHCFYEPAGFGVNGTSLYDFIKNAKWPNNIEGSPGEAGAEDWICCAYEAWLRAWKGAPEGGKWHLWIGFERSSDTVAQTWGKRLTGNRTTRDYLAEVGSGSDDVPRLFQSNLVSIVVRSRVSDTTETWLSDPGNPEFIHAADEALGSTYWDEEYRRPYSKKRALVFDNHGKCFHTTHEAQKALDYRRSSRFYQKTSANRTFELVERLINPPSSFFGFNFFVLNLVESCLAVVAVADERITAGLLFACQSSDGEMSDARCSERSSFTQQLAAYQKTGIFPLFQLNRGNGADSQFAHYSDRHRSAFRQMLGVPADQDSAEGLWLSDQKMMQVVVPTHRGEFEMIAGEGHGTEDFLAVDFLVVHEGAIDIFTANSGLKWSPSDTKALFGISPGVVRTSGRGRHSRNLGNRVPFLEASTLTAALVTSSNKYSLSRALLGATTTVEGEER
jgi:hypothetical protein